MIAELRRQLQQTEAELQKARTQTPRAEAAPSTQPPVNLDQEFRDIARMCIIAVPHILAHMRNVIDNQDKIKGVVATTAVILQTMEATRGRALACIPQAIPQLVSLLAAKQPNTVREASFALALTSTSPEGRGAMLDMPQAVPHLETLLQSSDVYARRHSALALGNLAMEPKGRRALMAVFHVIEDLTNLLTEDDLDCARSVALALGNAIVEVDARDLFLQIPMSVRVLSEQLKAADRLLVRYATGALRNVAVDEKGRRAVLSQQDAVASLKGLLSSPDTTTARFAESALKNLSLTPFNMTMGPMDPGRNGRIQVPYRAEGGKPSVLGFELPYTDSDGLMIPQLKQRGYGAPQVGF